METYRTVASLSTVDSCLPPVQCIQYFSSYRSFDNCSLVKQNLMPKAKGVEQAVK